VALIEPATSAKRVSDVLRDLESGFLVAGQRQVWLERGRAEWVASVRALGRTDASIGDDNVSVYVTLLGQLAGSLKEESFRVEFVTPTPWSADVFWGPASASEALLNSAREFLSRRGVSLYERWRMQLEALVGFNGAPESEDESGPFAWRMAPRRMRSRFRGLEYEDYPRDPPGMKTTTTTMTTTIHIFP
jgi:hypothetical protein